MHLDHIYIVITIVSVLALLFTGTYRKQMQEHFISEKNMVHFRLFPQTVRMVRLESCSGLRDF